MKKIILSLSFLMAVTVAFSQSVMTSTGTSGAAKTIHTNADTSYHKTDLNGPINNFNYITIVLAGTKTSGTVGGTAVLQGSMDNSRWINVTDTAGKGSQTIANSDNDLVWEILGNRYRYYRVRIYTTGTQVSSYVCRLLGRKKAD